MTRGRTADNLNLPGAYVARMEAEYRGTRKGREELDGELIDEVEGALWTRALIEKCRVAAFRFRAAAGAAGAFARTALAQAARADGAARRELSGGS